MKLSLTPHEDHRPMSKLAEQEHTRVASRYQSIILSFIDVQVTAAYQRYGEIMLDWDEESRLSEWKSIFEANPLSLVRGMRKPVQYLIDLDAMVDPPKQAPGQQDQGHKRFIFRILVTHKPDSALFLEAKATSQDEYMRWRAMALEGKVDVPNIHTCPVYTTAGNSNRFRKGATRTGVKLQKTIKDREDFKFDFDKPKK
ncbi:hypothetical protein IWZ01DRAFT_571000 [Phyllosticta capitalensis]